MADLNALKAANERRWKNARITRGSELTAAAKRLVANKAHYVAVSAKTGVPWPFIAVAHLRESNANFAKSLAQGDPWDRVSTHVPKGRGPFKSWEEAAIDALVACPPFAARNTDWSIGGTLTMLERYNGLGYANKGLPSPYIWSGTDQYQKGKYVADGVFDPNVVDKQLGCAGVILAMIAQDPTISFGKPVPVVTKPAEPKINKTAAAVTTAGGAVVVGAGAAAQQGISAMEILAWIGGISGAAIAAFILGYRAYRGHWPWNSTGNQSQELSLLSRPSSAPSSEQVSAALSAVSSAGSPAARSPQPSASKPRRKPSAKRSQSGTTPRRSSSKSKPTAAKKSALKPKSKSKLSKSSRSRSG